MDIRLVVIFVCNQRFFVARKRFSSFSLVLEKVQSILALFLYSYRFLAGLPKKRIFRTLLHLFELVDRRIFCESHYFPLFTLVLVIGYVVRVRKKFRLWIISNLDFVLHFLFDRLNELFKLPFFLIQIFTWVRHSYEVTSCTRILVYMCFYFVHPLFI